MCKHVNANDWTWMLRSSPSYVKQLHLGVKILAVALLLCRLSVQCVSWIIWETCNVSNDILNSVDGLLPAKWFRLTTWGELLKWYRTYICSSWFPYMRWTASFLSPFPRGVFLPSLSHYLLLICKKIIPASVWPDLLYCRADPTSICAFIHHSF